MLPVVPIRPVVSGATIGSKRGPVGWGPVGEELHALTARETIATATTVRLRRDIGDSGVRTRQPIELLLRT